MVDESLVPGVKSDTGQGAAGAHAVSVEPPAPKPTEVQEKPVVAKREVARADESEEEMVQVPKKTLETILKRVDALEDDNKVLKQVADKGRMARVEALRAQGKLVKSVRVGQLHGKFVVGWKLIEDDVHFEGDKLIEKQTIRVFFEDKSNEDIGVRAFANETGNIEGEVISESKDRDGNISLLVQLPDGKELTIGQNFINI